MRDTVKLIIDTDPGVDDAMAIFYAAAAPEIELLGLTTIFGNVTVETATRNALRLVEKARLSVPVAEGAKTPLELPPFKPSAHVHGAEGFGDIPAEAPAGETIAATASDFLIRMAHEHKGELVICPIGPLTNVALAIQKDPEFIQNVKRIVLMGGSYKEGGNITPHAEANIYHDPHAAEVVFASGARVEMVGLDVTHRILCRPEDFAEMAKAAPDLGGMLQDMSHFYLAFYEAVGKHDGCSLHDPAAVIACTHPELFGVESVQIRVETEGATAGATVAAGDGRKETAVLMSVQSAAVKELFMERIRALW